MSDFVNTGRGFILCRPKLISRNHFLEVSLKSALGLASKTMQFF